MLPTSRLLPGVPVRWKSPYSVKQKRAYHRFLSGLERSNFCGERVRFLTLTTSKDGSYADLNRHFLALVKRLRRKFGSFEYCKIKTNEGNGVLHVVFWDAFDGWRYGCIHAYLSVLWMELHESPNVWCRALFGGFKRMANYVVCHYVAGQSLIKRLSWSWGWCKRGFVS